MNRARIIVLCVAIGAGLLAALMARNLGGGETVIVESGPNIETSEVLVALDDIPAGSILTEASFGWEEWPEASINDTFVSRGNEPDAATELTGAVARSAFFEGEPIRRGKLAIAGPGGFLAATLQSGMRAVSTRTSPQSGAGGFILPNDRVDVILTRREPDPNDQSREIFVAETVLQNVRVLAIDQVIEEDEGQKVVVGDVATLELNPRQAEILTLTEQLGEISLALRSILDGSPDDEPKMAEHLLRGGGSVDGISIIKFGVQSQVGR